MESIELDWDSMVFFESSIEVRLQKERRWSLSSIEQAEWKENREFNWVLATTVLLLHSGQLEFLVVFFGTPYAEGITVILLI
jgi:hypothetical protein